MNTDEASFPNLTHRQEEILALIIRAYSQSPEPVSSKYLVDNASLQVSSATIRNEMAALEELGLIAAPHTSAGRVPTESGYRYFVHFLIQSNGLSSAEETQIAEKLHNTPLATEQWMNAAANTLARAAQTAALVTPPAAETSRFKRLELISIQGRLVLMVLVLNQGSVFQQMLTLAEPVPQPRLTDATTTLNSLCVDNHADDIRVRAAHLPTLEHEIAELITDLMERTAAEPVRLVYRDGLSDLISAFQHNQGAQQAIRVVEERGFLSNILSEVLAPKEREVQVVIAGNGRWEELSHMTMIVSRYGIPGQASGAVGVVGPTNLNYGRAISAVSYISNVMTSLLASAYLETGDEE
jgi:heat-inducible transcriptional repressor